MQIKAMRCHYTSIKIGKMQNTGGTSTGQGMEQQALTHCWANTKWKSHTGRHFGYFL